MQEQLVAARRAGEVGDRLLLLEHPPVITLGRNARAQNVLASEQRLAARGVELHRIRRGGDVTYHAPGQLVGYLIVDLTARGAPDVHAFLRRIESCLIASLEELGVPARPIAGWTGVFADRGRSRQPVGPERKLASIGVGLRGWVSQHGFALNVTTDLSGFESIIPCGLSDIEMSSVVRELGLEPPGLASRAREVVGKAFVSGFS